MAGNYNQFGIEFDLVTIDGIFSERRLYSVPHYQRGYSWGSDEISDLLNDIDDAMRDFPAEAYLLGQIIVCPTQDLNLNRNLNPNTGQFDIIDGQQRLTTLFLIINNALSTIDALLTEESDSSNVVLKYEFNEGQKARIGEWRNFLKIWGKDDKVTPKVRPAQDGEEVLLRLLNSNGPEIEDGLSPTQNNLIAGVQTIRDWFGPMGLSEVYRYLEFMMDSVHLVQITLKTSAQALRVFQKVNNRGLELDNADLIKSFLFQHVASDDDYERFASAWDSAAKHLLNAQRKPLKNMETFMKMLIGIRTGQYVSKGNLYERWEDELAIDRKNLHLTVPQQKSLTEPEKSRIRTAEVAKLVGNLQSDAQSLVHISKSEVPIDGSKTDLAYGFLTSGFIQPYEVLLAGAHLSKASYFNLLRIVEDRSMLSSWSNEPKNLFEPIIHPWANRIAALDPHASRAEILEASGVALEKLPELFENSLTGIRRFTYEVQAQRSRIRYFLARGHIATQKKFNVTVPSIRDLMKTTNPSSGERGYDLDHIFPKSQSKLAAWEVSKENDKNLGTDSRYRSKVHSVGNLILLHPEDNREQSDELPWSDEKISNLAQSELFLNRFLVPHEFLSGSPKVVAAAKEAQSNGFPTISDKRWGEEQVDELVGYYWRLVVADVQFNLS